MGVICAGVPSFGHRFHGWFDIDNSYYFNYTQKQFIVKLPPENDPRYIKLWPYQYYGDFGESAHVSLIYDFIIPN